MASLEVVELTPAVRTELMVLVAKKLQQAAAGADLSVTKNAYAVAVPLVDSVSRYLGDCKLQESPSEPMKRLLVPAGE